jgi:hypothetical protein
MIRHVLGVLCFLVLLPATALLPVPPVVCVLLSVRPLIMLQRGDIRVEMRVSQHADHRWLVLTWDGGNAGAGSSREQLAGENADVLHTRWLRAQAPSEYLFVSAVYNGRAIVVGRDTAEIHTPETP